MQKILAGHEGKFANDGNAATFWRAAAGETNSWWCVDLERIVMVNQTKLVFPSAGDWRYQIEISDDGNSNWKMVADQAHVSSAEKIRTDIAPAGASAALSELQLTGSASLR